MFIIQLGQSEMITKSEQYHVEVGDQGIVDYMGHSGEIGNAPNLTGKKTKIMLGMCSTHIYL